MDMDPDALALLVEIVDAGNLSQAARKLRMTRANVSYRLGQLEKAVGVQLLRRTTRRVEPTEVGLRLCEHGRAIQNELRAARESVATLAGSLHGRLRISVPSGYGQIVMSEWLIAFKRLYPGVVLEVMFENRVDDLLRDEVDIVIKVVTEPPPALVARHLGPVRYLACAAPDFAALHGMPVVLADLATAPVITAGVVGRHLRLSAYRAAERQEVLLQPTLVSANFIFLREAIDAGLGIGLVPDYMAQHDIDTGRLVGCLDDWRLSIFGTQMYLLYMPDRHHTLAASTFIDFIVGKAWSAGRIQGPKPAPLLSGTGLARVPITLAGAVSAGGPAAP